MAEKMEMSLDDIIAQGRKSSRGGARSGGRDGRRDGGRDGGGRRGGGSGGPVRRGGRGEPRSAPYSSYSRGNVESKWQHDMYEGGSSSRNRTSGPSGGSSSSSGTGKLLISNLDFGVTENDLKELFSEFGPLDKAQVHYDRSGRSLGTADIVFLRRGDAISAKRQYNGVPLDGQPMDIILADGGGGDDVGSAKSRLGVRRVDAGRMGSREGNNRSDRRDGPRSGGRPRGGARGGGRGGGSGKKEQISAEELDKQLDEYLSQK